MKMVEKQKMDWKVWERIGDDDREADVAAMTPLTRPTAIWTKAVKKLDFTGRYPCDRPLVSNPPDVEEF
jgi:hypothetical protein